MSDRKLYINGAFCDSSTGDHFANINPATGDDRASSGSQSGRRRSRRAQPKRRSMARGAYASGATARAGGGSRRDPKTVRRLPRRRDRRHRETRIMGAQGRHPARRCESAALRRPDPQHPQRELCLRHPRRRESDQLRRAPTLRRRGRDLPLEPTPLTDDVEGRSRPGCGQYGRR